MLTPFLICRFNTSVAPEHFVIFNLKNLRVLLTSALRACIGYGVKKRKYLLWKSQENKPCGAHLSKNLSPFSSLTNVLKALLSICQNLIIGFLIFYMFCNCIPRLSLWWLEIARKIIFCSGFTDSRNQITKIVEDPGPNYNVFSLMI